MADPISVEAGLRVCPISTEDWMKLPQREQQLSAIADVIGYWITWATKERQAENLPLNPDAHIILPGDNAPPHWPSIGQLSLWLKVLRAHPDAALSNTSDTVRVPRNDLDIFERVTRLADTLTSDVPVTAAALGHVRASYDLLATLRSASTIPDVGEGK